MTKILKILKNISFLASALLISCTLIPVNSINNSKFNSPKVDIDKLYQNFKINEKKNFDELMKIKKTDNFELKIKINTNLQEQEKSFNLMSSDDKSNIRKKIWLLGEHSTNKAHLGETNIFDPNKNLSNSGLSPYDGDILISQQKNISHSKILINNSSEIDFYSRIVNIELKDESKINDLSLLYGAEKFEKYKNTNRFILDISKADISKLNKLIEDYNNLIPESIKDIEFSSVASLKTFTILLDIFINHKEIYKSISFDKITKVNSSTYPRMADYYPNDFQNNRNELFFDYLNKQYIDSGNDPERPSSGFNYYIYLYKNSLLPNTFTDYSASWWLQETNIVNSWLYGIGTNINIAHIDSGFFGLNQNINNKNFDLDSRRLLLDKENKQKWSWLFFQDDLFSNNSNLSPSERHGYSSVITCCAERDNNIGTVGASPNTNIIPYIAGSNFEQAKAIDKAIEHGANIISYNSSNYYNKYLFYLSGDQHFEETVVEAAKNTTIVLSAGNEALNISEVTPARLGIMSSNDGIIVVGGTDIRVNRSNYLEIGVAFDRNREPRLCGTTASSSIQSICNGKGSNYGVNVVYAPWGGRYISAYNNVNFKELFDGNSGSEPTVAGIIANMLSRNKNLSPSSIEEIIVDTSNLGTKIKPHEYIPAIPSYLHDNLHMINAEEAIKEAISQRID
ncbi:MAG: S8/S53 family peptidase, partial [Candidatus Sericytochromatia bacterium]